MLTLTVPKQYDGAQSDNSFTVKSNTANQAEMLYQRAKENLLQVNKWGKIAGGLSAKFQLANSLGDALYRHARVDDYIKIKLPAAGSNYDWVQIETIQEIDEVNHQQIIMRVRPASNPETTEESTEHFLKNDATSSFIIERNAEKVTASILGRNELPNTGVDSLLNKVRNALIAFFVMVGLNTPQWKALAKGLLTKN